MKKVKDMKKRIKLDIKCILFLIFLLSTGALICAETSSAASGNIYVDNATGDDAQDGHSAVYNGVSGPKLTIKNATDIVDAGGTVHIADGRYTGEGNRYISIDRDMTITGESQEGTIIDAQHVGQIFNVNRGVTLTLENMTLKNGNDIFGGAVFNFGTLVVKNCTFTGNTATWGAAILNSYGCTLKVSDSTFMGNTANDGEGGAIWNGMDGTLNVTSCDFIYNNVTNGPGGAILNNGITNVDDSFFYGNNAVNWGGSAIWNCIDSTLTVANSTFKGNNAGGEGTVYNDQATLNVADSYFQDNLAAAGGAIFDNYGQLKVTGTYFINNTATNGGAISVSGYASVNGSTFTNNTAEGDGGAIYNEETLSVAESTFTGNTATGGSGGAIYNKGDCTVNFSRIVSNTATKSGSAIYGQSGSADTRYNWWGSNGNPAGKVYGEVDTSPWLILNVTASSKALGKNGKSYITADLNCDSDDVRHDPADGHLPDYISMIFTVNVGGITNQKYTFNSVATNVFSAGSTSNTAALLTLLDEETIQINIVIDAGPPTAAANPKGSLSNTVKSVTLTAADSQDKKPRIYYTTNGNNPNVKGALYTKPIAINKSTTLKFVAVDAAGNTSPIYMEVYTIDATKPTVKASLNGEIYNTSKTVTLTAVDNLDTNPKIYYTTNGATPTVKSKLYTGPITVGDTTTLRFLAVDAAGNPSGAMIETYTIDKTAPKITSTDPAGSATNVVAGKTIKATFNEAVKLGTGKVVLKNSGGKAVPLNKLWISGGRVLIADPKSNLAESLYTLVIGKGAVTDLAGNPQAAKTIKFSVGASPIVKVSDPKNGAVKVKRSKSIKVTFSENIKASSNYRVELVVANGSKVSIKKSIKGKVLTIAHTAKLKANTKYKLVIYTGSVSDLAGNPLKVKTVTFVTGST